jgi:hypothetical protein
MQVRGIVIYSSHNLVILLDGPSYPQEVLFFNEKIDLKTSAEVIGILTISGNLSRRLFLIDNCTLSVLGYWLINLATEFMKYVLKETTKQAASRAQYVVCKNVGLCINRWNLGLQSISSLSEDQVNLQETGEE